MKILYPYLRQYKKLIGLALFLAAVNQVFSLLDPVVFRHVIDDYATKPGQYTEGQFFAGVLKLLALAVGVAFVSRVAKNFQDYFVNVITNRMGAQVYTEGLEHSLQLPYSVFEDQRSGETLGKLQKVRLDIERVIQMGISFVFTTLIGVIFVTIYAFTINWLVAPVYFATIPIIGYLSSFLSRKIKKVQKTIVAETTALAGSTTESLRNIELVKSLGLADQEIGRLNATTGKILQLELKKVKYIRSLSFIQGTTINFLRTSISFLMLYLIFKQSITFGQYFSLYIYSFFIFGPLQELGNFINIYRESEASLDNFAGIMAMPAEEKPADAVSVKDIRNLSFKHVSFQHQSATTKALQDVSFSVDRGETIAFVGPSGSGKTTLVKLLVGLYRPQSGEVQCNGVATDKLNLDELRNRIGFVTQDTQLFSGSIRENLLFVRPEASDDDCMRVLHQAACDSLLARASNGLDTVIGEGGVKVSGGEKQRLSIARALLRNPQLLVFDEATSSLDSITEEEISKTIRDVSTQSDQITILIAHRLSTVLHADQIYVLERGHIVESGKHQDLLAEKGLYYAMWRQQIGERSIDQITRIPVPVN
ncbi:MAG: ABC transporter ATP-binding protein [Bacteroidota bacterium]|nr:ABC transporter ATP-binding protein [Bacteroidota bacterium]